MKTEPAPADARPAAEPPDVLEITFNGERYVKQHRLAAAEPQLLAAAIQRIEEQEHLIAAITVRAEQAEQRILALEQKLEASTGTLKTVCQRIVHEQQWRGQAEARLARLVDGLEALERHGFSPFVSEWGAAVRALIAAAKQESTPR